MELPPFHPVWTAWNGREGIPDAGHPGLYVIARFDGGPPDSVDVTDEEVLYVGETTKASLTKRWKDFERSALRQGTGSSGGHTFNRVLLRGKTIREPPSWLYVSAHPVLLEGDRRRAYIKYLERAVIWGYVDRHGRFPACNSE